MRRNLIDYSLQGLPQCADMDPVLSVNQKAIAVQRIVANIIFKCLVDGKVSTHAL